MRSKARIVEACSHSLADTGKGKRKAHWRKRKEAYLARLQRGCFMGIACQQGSQCAHNLSCELRKPDIAEKVWARFNVPTKQTLWCYHSLVDIFCERLSNQLSTSYAKSLRYWRQSGQSPSSGECLDVGPSSGHDLDETERHHLELGDCVRPWWLCGRPRSRRQIRRESSRGAWPPTSRNIRGRRPRVRHVTICEVA